MRRDDEAAAPPSIGLLAEFETPQAVLKATRQARRGRLPRMDAYTPYPVEGWRPSWACRARQMPFVVLTGGIVGAGVGFFMQYWSMAVDYPFNVGGRPYNSWPVFIPITFEVMILVASLSALFGMLFLNGLPRPHHPVFNVPQLRRGQPGPAFSCASRRPTRSSTRRRRGQFLAGLNAKEVLEIPHEAP